ncbi:hypothetical protein LguiA_004441 [Lonicera macranthoides]
MIGFHVFCKLVSFELIWHLHQLWRGIQVLKWILDSCLNNASVERDLVVGEVNMKRENVVWKFLIVISFFFDYFFGHKSNDVM